MILGTEILFYFFFNLKRCLILSISTKPGTTLISSCFYFQETIGGRQMTEYFSALYIVKTSLISLNMRSLREIRSGSVAILENQELCYAQNINWKQIMKSSSHNTLLQNNRPPQKCIPESKICDTQCAESGCWGPGKGMCLSCKHYTVENECVGSCDPNLGLYQSSESKCMKCHAECELTCTGKKFNRVYIKFSFS